MSEAALDVLGLGHAIVDVIAAVPDGFLGAHGLDKGSMRLVDAGEAVALYGAMPPAREVSGGSAANTMAGLAALGGRAGFIGRRADDQLGAVFAHDITAAGVAFGTAAGDPALPTGRSLIAVTPDGERTMTTFLGAAGDLGAEHVDADAVASAATVYLEGYLWDPERPRAALSRAMVIARGAGRRVAFTLSDAFLIGRHGDDFRALLRERVVDVLFANEAEAVALTGSDGFDGAAAALAGAADVVVITRGTGGAVVLADGGAHAVAASAARVVDTTGAGDLFAAGFLFGMTRGLSWTRSAEIGAVAAAEVISHLGARPEADLRALAAV